MSKHTPGPWKQYGQEVFSDDKNETFICNTPEWLDDPSYDEQIANARLIAAAPELLAALKAMRNRLAYAELIDQELVRYVRDPQDDIIKAIAKAEGIDE